MIWDIQRCYDSHVHLLATGMMQSGLRLFDLNHPQDVMSLEIKSQHFRGQWLTGFGWDHNKWPEKKYPTKEVLDSVFPDFPVAFSRADGHAVWLNSRALEIVGYLNKTEQQKASPVGGVIVRDEQGMPTGVFIELAKVEVDLLIPNRTEEQQIQFLKDAVKYFNKNGFTHVRDMSGSLSQWELLRKMDQAGDLSLYVEQNFSCENRKDFQRAMEEILIAKNSETQHLRAGGIKFYFDGALGSEGAFISQFYSGSKMQGMTLWPMADVEYVIEETWKNGFEVCVHTIGDQAAHLIVEAAMRVQEKCRIRGRLTLEHAEILRPETIQKMKDLNILCHLQPCHWLSDQRWLNEKIPGLLKFAFPWRSLQEAGISMQWGSDSPIEEASIENTYRALIDSEAFGIPKFDGDLLAPHVHRDINWGAECSSLFRNGKVYQVTFDRKLIHQT